MNQDNLKKTLRITQIICVISSLLSLSLLIVVIVLITRISPLVEFAKEASPKLDQVSAFIEENEPVLNDISEFISDAGPALEQLSTIDADALNKNINGLSQLDTKELSQALKNLNNIVDDLNEISNRFRSLFSIF